MQYMIQCLDMQCTSVLQIFTLKATVSVAAAVVDNVHIFPIVHAL